MLSLGLTNNEMELRFSEFFTSYEMELETHGHVHIENQLGLVGYDVVYYTCMHELLFSELFTSYEMELETHGHVQTRNQLGFLEHHFACLH